MEETVRKVLLTQPLDINNVNIVRDYNFSNAYIIDLPLTGTPNHVWSEAFERTWRTSRYLWDRKLLVTGERLRLVTTPDELVEKLDWVKQVMKETNEAIEEYNLATQKEKERIREEIIRQEQSEENPAIEAFKENMKRRFA